VKLPPVPRDRNAEQLGRTAREFGNARESNSYLEHRKPAGEPDDYCDMLIAAWSRGRDAADAMLKGRL